MPDHVLKKRTVYALLICFLLGACGALTQSDKPAVTTWWLVPYKGGEARVVSSPVNLTLVSFEVTAVPGLDTNKILALTSASELKPYAGARWADHVPDLVESLLGRSLEASGSFKVAARGTVQSGEVCKLRLEVREFFTGLNGSGQTDRVMILFAGEYQCGSGEAVLLQLGSALPIQDGQMKNIVASFQEAMNDVTKELLKTI